jgi:hypothetical protein
MFLVLTGVLNATPSPAPLASPLKTITHVHSSPFCTAFTQNIKHGVEGVLTNDDLFKRTEPVFLKAARDMVMIGVSGSSFNSLHPATGSADNPSVHLDMARLQEIADAIVRNLETIDRILNDPIIFPKSPKTEEDRQLVQLRAQLLAVAKQQNDELNVISGTTDQYMFDTLYNQDVSLGGALSANGKSSPNAGVLQGGPFKGIGGAADPALSQNGLFMNSPMGAMYGALVQRESIETAMESQLAQMLAEASAGCK